MGKFPKTIHIVNQPDGDGGEFLLVSDSPDAALGDLNEDEGIVAVYTFNHCLKVKRITQVERIPA